MSYKICHFSNPDDFITAQRLAVEPPSRLCTRRFSIQQAPSKTPCALPPSRRLGRFQPRVGHQFNNMESIFISSKARVEFMMYEFHSSSKPIVDLADIATVSHSASTSCIYSLTSNDIYYNTVRDNKSHYIDYQSTFARISAEHIPSLSEALSQNILAR